jgi:hypothetical protein
MTRESFLQKMNVCIKEVYGITKPNDVAEPGLITSIHLFKNEGAPYV